MGDMITSVEAIPLRIRREQAYLGPIPLGSTSDTYFLRPPYRVLYSAYFETLLVKITTSEGLIGWGEALAPVAPAAVGVIITQLLEPLLVGGDALAGDYLWKRMYDSMRDRGHGGG